ncbi:MAG: hypothetical protein ACLQGP_36770 [Isosphaeraceae bacterium]
MILRELRAHLERLDVRLVASQDGKLRLSIPDDTELPDELMEAIREHRDVLVAWSSGQTEDTSEDVPPPRTNWRDLPDMSPGPRDFRKGDRWLPWHAGPTSDPYDAQERAGIHEFDAGMTRAEAERAAGLA